MAVKRFGQNGLVPIGPLASLTVDSTRAGATHQRGVGPERAGGAEELEVAPVTRARPATAIARRRSDFVVMSGPMSVDSLVLGRLLQMATLW